MTQPNDLAALEAVVREAVANTTVTDIHTHLFSLHGWHPFDRHYQAVVAAMEERGIATVQSFPAFSGYEEEGLWVNPRDWHPHARANPKVKPTG